VTPGTLATEGCRCPAVNVEKGKTYRFSIYLRGNSGGEKVRVAIGSSTVGNATTNAILTAKFARYDVSFTATESGAAQIAVTTQAAETKAITFYAQAALVEESASLGEYFPLPSELVSGLSGWSGTDYESVSQTGPFVNGAGRTYIGVASRTESATGDAILGSSAGGSNTIVLRTVAGSQTVLFSVNGNVNRVEWANAWPGNAVAVAWALTFNETTNAVELFINGVSQGVKELTQTITAPGTLTPGITEASGNPFIGSMLPLAAFPRVLSAAELTTLALTLGMGPMAATAGSMPMRLLTAKIGINGSGLANWDLSDEATGLTYSNKAPGGDYICTFTVHRPWKNRNEELDKGNYVRVTEGLEVLWQGRIEEVDRGQDGDDETLTVTAYGLGNRLKDGTIQEIYIDQLLSRWGPPSIARQLALRAVPIVLEPTPEALPSVSSGLPGILFVYARLTEGATGGEMWYYGGGVDLGKLLFNFKGSGLDAAWSDFALLTPTDNSLGDGTGDFDGVAESNEQGLLATVAGRKYAAFQTYRTQGAAKIDPYGGSHRWEVPKVLGRHGLTQSGTWPNIGFLVSTLIQDVVRRTEPGTYKGITTRQIDATTYVLQQAEFIQPVSFEEAIEKLHEVEKHHRTWGTWATNSVLWPIRTYSLSEFWAYFDYVEIDTTASWYAFREECDNEELHTEIGSLFDHVEVRYTDVNGVQRISSRSVTIPELEEANLSPRTISIDGGTMDEEDAAALGDAALALTGGFAPARGSIELTGTVRHITRGRLPAQRMRADGSAIRLIDVLPTSQLLSLTTAPDRRTTFPIKEVVVDASNMAEPKVTINVDQVNEAMSALQARVSLDTNLQGL
jgi:hypothetical protein